MSTQGQSLNPNVITSSSGGGNLNGDNYYYVIGEMPIVSTDNTANNKYTQGFLQPHITLADAISDQIPIQNNLQIYPNPIENQIEIHLINTSIQIKQILLTDITGKVIKKIISPDFENNTLKIEANDLSIGTYLLRIDQFQTIKISKK
jgi:hypothetical protein